MIKHKSVIFPDYGLENQALAEGYHLVAGVDEVGRGPLAGPVVAAAVILLPDRIPEGLNDSKKLTEKRRIELFGLLSANAVIAVSSISSAHIDELNIRQATLAAMVEAVKALSQRPDYVLIDGRDIPSDLAIEAEAVIRGDGRSVSIAAASIVAKVVRDRMMVEADRYFPGYEFSRHKGYGSKLHRERIKKWGPCPLHRYSFAPVKNMKKSRTKDMKF